MTDHEKLINDYLQFLCYKGWKQKIEPVYKEDAQKYQQYKDRLALELKVIQDKNLSSYHLIVADYVNWAMKQGIMVGPARGSAAGSLICFLIGITRVDPIKYDLLFERYINPERKALSDIDLDFEDRRRDEVKEYLRKKYGEDKVVGIATLSRLGAKSAIKDIARSLQIAGDNTFGVANIITETIPGSEMSLEEARKISGAFDNYMNQYPELWMYATKLEGIIRQPGMHAAGVVISDKPLADYMPLQVQKEMVTTQYDKDILEEAGFLKVDLLGLKNLTIIQDTKRNIKKIYGKELKKIPFDDEKTYEMLRNGFTAGVFQLESHGMRTLLKDIAVNCIDDLSAVLALFRPGPLDAGMADQYAARKHGREPIVYDHPLLERSLKPTYGLIVYEEQIQQIACDLSGFTLGKADTMRRACKKKDPEIMRGLEDEFVQGAVNKGVPSVLAKSIFEKIVFFSGYSFNKSHSLSYSLISFFTSFLKANFTTAYIAALLSNEGDDDKKLEYKKECSVLNIKLLPPSVQISNYSYVPVSENAIQRDLVSIKKVGAKAVNIVKQCQPFKDTIDFLIRTNDRSVNNTTLLNLCKSGALDCFNIERRSLIDYIVDCKDKLKKHLKKGEKAEDFKYIFLNTEPLTLAERLQYEFEATGEYISGNKSDMYPGFFNQERGIKHAKELLNLCNNSLVNMELVINKCRMRRTIKEGKNQGKPWAIFEAEDVWGDVVDIIMWPTQLEKFGDFMQSGEAIKIEGQINMREGSSAKQIKIRRIKDSYSMFKMKNLNARENDKEFLAGAVPNSQQPVIE